MSKGAILVNGGPFSEALTGALRATHPDEMFVAAGPARPARPNATQAAAAAAGVEIVATLLNDPSSVPPLLSPSVRWVHVLAAGMDGFPFGQASDCVLTCSRGAAAVAISEWVLAVMLAFEKQLPQSFLESPPPQWNIASLGTLEGKTLGLIGLGAIGEEIAKRALAFSMAIVALRRRNIPSPVPEIELTRDLGALLAVADHVVVAAPATAATERLLDGAALAKCKRGVHLVNIARGSLVDEEALRAALDADQVACASLDTVAEEPLPAGHWMYSHPKVRLSAHISWSSPVTMPRTLEIFSDNLTRYRSGQALLGLVDAAAGY